MTAFGSHCDQTAPALENALVIAVANSCFSILSGACLFGVMGYMAQQEGDFRIYAGPSLLFGVYPAALSTIPGGLHWVRFLFFNLILLGLDSAFALVEAVASLITDSQYGRFVSKQQVVGGICTLGFLTGLLYTTDAGLVFLDTILRCCFWILQGPECRLVLRDKATGTESRWKMEYCVCLFWHDFWEFSLCLAGVVWRHG